MDNKTQVYNAFEKYESYDEYTIFLFFNIPNKHQIQY